MLFHQRCLGYLKRQLVQFALALKMLFNFLMAIWYIFGFLKDQL
jgi:hypothetical protein